MHAGEIDWARDARSILKIAKESYDSDQAIEELSSFLRDRFKVHLDNTWDQEIGEHLVQKKIDMRDALLDIVEGMRDKVSEQISETIEHEFEEGLRRTSIILDAEIDEV